MNARKRSSLTARQRGDLAGRRDAEGLGALALPGEPDTVGRVRADATVADRRPEHRADVDEPGLDRAGASAGRSSVPTVIDFTQVSTWVVLIARSGIAPNGVDRTASDIATWVLGIHTCRAAHDSKNCSRVIDPALPSTHVPDSTRSQLLTEPPLRRGLPRERALMFGPSAGWR
jgi:hypothetical protein